MNSEVAPNLVKNILFVVENEVQTEEVSKKLETLAKKLYRAITVVTGTVLCPFFISNNVIIFEQKQFLHEKEIQLEKCANELGMVSDAKQQVMYKL